jgi:predicted metal-dependent phosphoesterase TrpH
LGYKALALTDYETDGGCKRFMRACEQEGIRSVTGAEFYGMVGTRCIHLTALDFDQDDPGLRAFIKQRCDVQAEFARKGLESGIARGIVEGITWDDVLQFADEGAWISINTVFNALYLKQAMPEQGEAYALAYLYNTEEMKALMPVYPSAEEVIKAVRNAGGVIALAHPDVKFVKYIGTLLDWGLNGIETEHPDISLRIQIYAQQFAKQYNLYQCGGTDHSGPMSSNGGKEAVPVFNGITEQQYDTLVERRLG